MTTRLMFRQCVACGEPANFLRPPGGAFCGHCMQLLDRISQATKEKKLTYWWRGDGRVRAAVSIGAGR